MPNKKKNIGQKVGAWGQEAIHDVGEFLKKLFVGSDPGGALKQPIRDRILAEQGHVPRGADERAKELIQLHEAIKVAEKAGNDEEAQALRTRLQLLIDSRQVVDF
jgi:hypothetical protein